MNRATTQSSNDPPNPGRIGHDPDALEAFYREHIAALDGFICRRVSDPHLAADLTADVFLAAMESAGRYHPSRGAPRAWLFGIARHVIAAQFREQDRDLRLTRRISGRALLDPDSLARVEERLDAAREARRLHALMQDLPEADRAVLELVALDGLGVSDVAQVLGVKPGTARVRLHRARRRLAEASAPTDPAARPLPHPSPSEA